MADLVRLDLSRFTRSDVAKVRELGRKLRLMHRWFRCERLAEEDGDVFALYSGDRGPKRYVSYRIFRRGDGAYELVDPRDVRVLARGRSIDAAIEAIPDDFFYNGG